jgi:hypothetical protein
MMYQTEPASVGGPRPVRSPKYKRDLDLQHEGFFSLDKDEQFERLVEFLRQANEEATSNV